tara:strand:+ start:2281 stop:2946 length:666 start_codon:yes stop_codon:yes gene_type:complete
MKQLAREAKHYSFLFHQGGIKKILDHAKENLFYDVKYGTDTSSWLEKYDFQNIPNLEHGVRYRASATSEARYGLNQASKYINLKDANFYDLGCGKGKVLCIASLCYDFKKIIGIDYYKPLLDHAANNLRHFRINDTVELHNMDMSLFTDYSPETVIYLYNPANDIILEKVRDNLEKATSRTVVIYNKPIHKSVFKNWKLVAQKREKDPDHNTSIFLFDKEK